MSSADFTARAISRNLQESLASTESGLGASLVGVEGGGTVQDRVKGVATREEMRILQPTDGDRVYLREPGREDEFMFDASNHSSKVTLDQHEGIYIAPDTFPGGANGAWVRNHSSGYFEVKWFGVVCDGIADYTAALQGAFDVCNDHYAYPDATLGTQYPYLVADGLIRLTGTVYPSSNSNRGFCGLYGRSIFSLAITWDHDGGGHVPVFDNGSKGENFKLINCKLNVASGALWPSTWIKTTNIIDWAFAVDGTYFGPAEESCIECGGVVNTYLRNFRFSETNGTFFKVNGDGNGAYNRLITFRDWTMHPRNSGNTMTSIVEIDLAGSDQYMVRFEGQRIEIDADALDPVNFDFLKITGTTSQVPAATLEIDGGGLQTNNGNYSGMLGAIRSETSGNKHVSLRLRNFKPEELDHFVSGNINSLSDWPSMAAFSSKIIDFEYATEGVIAFRGGRYSQPLSANPLQPAASASAITANAADLHKAQGNMLHVSATADTNLTALSNRGQRDLVFLRKTSGTAITISNGGDFSVPQPVTLETNAYVGFIYDYNANKWRLLENVIKQTGSSITAPTEDLTSLKTAIDDIRSVLTESGFTN